MNEPTATPSLALLDDLPEVFPPHPSLPETSELRPGDKCPYCQVERLDYDGMLNLACPRCGTISGGCFT